MEGPSLVIAAEQLISFKGKKVEVVSGNTKIGKERLLGKRVEDIFSWGKHLVFQFDDFAMRVHFLLFGTYEADIDGVTVTGDYKRTREPRLAMTFATGQVRMFNCSIKIFETNNLRATYDFSIDIMSPAWDGKKVAKLISSHPDEEIADVLLDQEIFAGVGNIIKNEVLSLVRVHPQALINDVSKKQIRELIQVTRSFSQQFYLWRKQFVLRKHLLVHGKSLCPHCGQKLIRGKTGKRQRWSYYCPICQNRLPT